MSIGPGASRTIVAVTGLAIEARIASGPGVRALAGGGNTRQLAIALERELARGAKGVISFGVAGGLAEDVVSGTWLVARAIVTSTMRWPCDAAWARMLAERLQGALTMDLTGADVPITKSADKRALYRTTGAAAVDTESHIAAAIAAPCPPRPSASLVPTGRVVADPFELFRALTGRRSAAQIRRFEWNVDPEPYLPLFDQWPFRLRSADLPE